MPNPIRARRFTRQLSNTMTTTEIESRAKAAGHSISGILILAGVNRATFWRWKTGRFQPRAASVERIRYVLTQLDQP